MYLKDSTWHTRYRSNFGLFKTMIVLTEKCNLLLKTWLGYFFFSSSINYWSKAAWLSPTRCMILYVNWRFLCFYSNKIKIWIWAWSSFNKKCWLLNWNKKIHNQVWNLDWTLGLERWPISHENQYICNLHTCYKNG